MKLDYTKIIDSLNKNRSDEGYKKFLELKIPKSQLENLTDDDYIAFIKSHGLGQVTKIEGNNYVAIYVDPENETDSRNLTSLSSELHIPIKEFFGLVQLDGDEPDASYNYDYPIDNGLTTMELKRREREYEKEHPKKKDKAKDKDTSDKDEDEGKQGIEEVTGASNIPSKMGAIDLMNTPIQKNRKKVLAN